MTPKEKANDLFNKYFSELRFPSDCEGCMQCVDRCGNMVAVAKKYSLIAVDEILHCESTEPSDTDWDECGSTAQYYWPQKKEDAGKFWGDVKSELQSL